MALLVRVSKLVDGNAVRYLRSQPNYKRKIATQLQYRTLATSKANQFSRIVDLRSDTVTQPTQSMLFTATQAPTGDDVMGEDPTILALQEYVADLFGKESALYVPTGTMGNLCAILAHCHYNKSAEMILGKHSHINLYEGGGYANLAGVSAKFVTENDDGMFDLEETQDSFRVDNDDHYAKTTLICLENTHNMLGGVALPPEYVDRIGTLAHETWREHGVKVHIDGARIFNSAISQSVSNNVERLAEDHANAQTLARELQNAGFYLPRNGKVDTNVVFFGLPEHCKISKEQLTRSMFDEYGVKILGGYNSGGKLFRLVTHMDVGKDDIKQTVDGIISLCCR
eukprot:scaffold3820_cov77-Cyclotella_meneghiniana.AAC.4